MALWIVGCATVGPDYRRPPVDAPAAWRLEEKEARDLADVAWWKRFDDPVLDELIDLALKQNMDLRLAAARVDEFLGRYAVARAGLFPQVAGAATTLRKGVTQYANPPWSAANPYTDNQVFFSASWEIDIWGRLRRAKEAALADLLSTEEAKRAVVLTVVAAVASAYTDLRDADKQLEIAQSTVRSREKSLKLFRLRFERGLVSKLELRQVESEYEVALATVPALQKSIAQQENALSVLLGQNPGEIRRGKSIDDLMLPLVPAGIPSQLLDRRPDIRQVEQNLIAANARIGIARAAYFPNITLTGTFGVESTSLSNLFSGPAQMWNYAASVSGPIFTAGAVAGTVKAIEAQQQQALIRYQQVIQQAFREVNDALIDQAKSREQLGIQKHQLEVLRSYAQLAKIRYENGYTSYLEVLDAERGLFTGEVLYAQTQGILFRALLNLYKSMGGGWVTEAEKLAGSSSSGK